MTLLTNPIIIPANVPQLIGVLKAGCRIARGIIDVLAALLSSPPRRGDIAGLYPRGEPTVQSRIERLCSYETSRFL
jgi:hypothetical protein